MKRLVASLGILGFAVWLGTPGLAYYAHGQRWAAGSSIAMHLQQGALTGALLDGSRDWNAVTEGALSTWNGVLSGVSFRAVPGSTAGTGLRNNINNVIWADDIYGDEFGDAVAVARWTYRVSDNSMVEADVVFDRRRNWNSYRGNLRAAPGSTLYDFRRVALHEFGHVLGLGHPDERGQSVSAIMNSRVSNIDSLQSDDTNGIRSIYGGAATSTTRTTATLPAGSRLAAEQTLVSPNARFRLLYQSDGNLVLYDDLERTAPWASNTGGTSAGSARLQGDGNFVIYDAQNVARWATATAAANARLVLQNDGNLVLYGGDSQPVWDRHR
jgi:hypothetical protein